MSERYGKLPPPGPAWGGSLMGTSIVARLLVEVGMLPLAGMFAVIACAILVVLTAGFVRYRNPAFQRTTLAAWAMYAMGILALGDALSGLSGEPVFRMIGFWIGALLAVVTYLTQLRGFHGPPQFSWGLPLVGPMVSASTAGALSRNFGHFYQVTGTVLFCMTIFTAVPLFTYVYWSCWRGRVPLEGATSATAWVPLGVAGQSTTAIQLLHPGTFSIWYGYVALIIAIPLALFAMIVFYPNVARWVDYSPAWWACTFPTGTVSMGSHQVALLNGSQWLDVVALSIPALLIAHWVICAARFVSWTISSRQPT